MFAPTEPRFALRGMTDDNARYFHIVSALGDSKPSDHMEMMHDLLGTEEPDFFFMELFLRDMRPHVQCWSNKDGGLKLRASLDELVKL